jgi:ribosomal protein L11 methyltransferase
VPQPLEADPAYPVVLRTYLPLDAEAEEKRQRIAQALWHLGHLRPVGALQVRVLEEQDWANAWKQFYSVQRIGAHTVIVPSWLDYTPEPGDIVLHLDPGMAFGTGLHPTTRLCLRVLEEVVQPGMPMLDLGAGSGILSIAAAMQGATPVLALDNDPVAVDVARENVQRNQQAEAVRVGLYDAPIGHLAAWMPSPAAQQALATAPPARFGLIVANIIADVLIGFAPDFAALLAPGGTLITSGIILDREDEVALALAAAGLHRYARHVEGEWVALLHRSTG